MAACEVYARTRAPVFVQRRRRGGGPPTTSLAHARAGANGGFCSIASSTVTTDRKECLNNALVCADATVRVNGHKSIALQPEHITN